MGVFGLNFHQVPHDSGGTTGNRECTLVRAPEMPWRNGASTAMWHSASVVTADSPYRINR
jgi:hypothetical protein